MPLKNDMQLDPEWKDIMLETDQERQTRMAAKQAEREAAWIRADNWEKTPILLESGFSIADIRHFHSLVEQFDDDNPIWARKQLKRLLEDYYGAFHIICTPTQIDKKNTEPKQREKPKRKRIDKQERITRIRTLVELAPDISNRKVADITGIPRSTIARIRKQNGNWQ